ncbi:MAG TPA: hypothetical protein VLC46_08320 [Thermoanaerobaculia bacterium]|jgi:hypothetical protein|nr:hypothetical protein [Thermoanaerobaculia bacterium]
MDEFLSLFAFRTGIPCGYLLFVLLGLCISMMALVAVLIGLLRKPRNWVLIFLGALVLSCAGIWVAGNVAYSAALDLNPVTEVKSVTGQWRWNGARLRLNSDGSYELNPGTAPLNSGRSVGQWILDGKGLHLTDIHGQVALDLRPIIFRGRLHLIIDLHEDPDNWDGDLGFSRPVNGG